MALRVIGWRQVNATNLIISAVFLRYDVYIKVMWVGRIGGLLNRPHIHTQTHTRLHFERQRLHCMLFNEAGSRCFWYTVLWNPPSRLTYSTDQRTHTHSCSLTNFDCRFFHFAAIMPTVVQPKRGSTHTSYSIKTQQTCSFCYSVGCTCITATHCLLHQVKFQSWLTKEITAPRWCITCFVYSSW